MERNAQKQVLQPI
jgi:hypothetical protein